MVGPGALRILPSQSPSQVFLQGGILHAKIVEGSGGGGGGIGAMLGRLAGGPVKFGTMHESTGHHFFFCSVKKNAVDIADAAVGDIHVVLDAGPIPPPLPPQSQSSGKRACDQVYAAYSQQVWVLKHPVCVWLLYPWLAYCAPRPKHRLSLPSSQNFSLNYALFFSTHHHQSSLDWFQHQPVSPDPVKSPHSHGQLAGTN